MSNGIIDTLGGLSPIYIRVSSSDRVGGGTTYVGTVTLRFDGPDTMTVFPHNPSPKKNNSTNMRDTLDLVLRSRYGSSSVPAKNVTVRIGRSQIVDIGGHNHDNPADTLPRPHGTYLWKNGSTWTSSPTDSLQQMTDSEGKLLLRFLATEVGGIEELKAIHIWPFAFGPEMHTFKRIATRVPRLGRLPSSDHYYQTGGTDAHHGPRLDGQFQAYRTPNNNHYIDSALYVSLDSAAMDFKRDPNNNTGALRINDLSLPNGGIFDISGRWTPAHFWHRLGNDVDIENFNIFVLTQWMFRHGWIYIEERDRFPHFYKPRPTSN